MKPAYLYAKVSEDNHVVLKWKWYGSTYDIAGFNIERRAVDVLDFTRIGTTGDYVFKDEDISADKKSSYIYRVHAFKGSVISGYSNEVRVDVNNEDIAALPEEKGTEGEPGTKPTRRPESTAAPRSQTPKPAATPITKTKPGTVWLVPDELQVQTGTHFTTSIHVNSGNQRLAAYGIIIEYSDALMDVNRAIGKEGVIAGSDGFVAAVNARDPGVLSISGIEARGQDPSEDLHLVSIQWKALSDGITRLNITIRDLNDEKTAPIKNISTIDGIVSIIPMERKADPMIVYNDDRWSEESSVIEESRVIEEERKDDNSSQREYYRDYNRENDDRDSWEEENEYYDDTDPDNPPFSSTAAPRGTARPTAEPGETEAPTARPTSTPKPTATPRPTSTPTPEPVITPTATPKKTTGPTTPPAPPGTGNIWFEPGTTTVDVGAHFSTGIHVDTGKQKLAAYGLDITYRSSVIQIDKNSANDNTGVTKGPDGFLAAVNSKSDGIISIAGFDTSGKGPGRDLHILNIFWKAVGPGTTYLEIHVDTLVDSSPTTIGNPSPKRGMVIVH